MTATAPKNENVTNERFMEVYKECQKEGLGWSAIAERLKMKENAAQARLQSIKNSLRESLKKMKDTAGQPFSEARIEELVEKAVPPIKRTGGGRKSDQKAVVSNMITELLSAADPAGENPPVVS